MTESLSGLTLKDETQREVSAVVRAMSRAGMKPPQDVLMMLEVIGHETEKQQAELDKTLALFKNSPMLRASVRTTPLRMGTDFEFVMHAADQQSIEGAQRMLDGMVHEKLKQEFRDVAGMDKLELGAVEAFMKAYRDIGVSNAHEFRANEVLSAMRQKGGVPLAQVQLLQKICTAETRERTEQIAGNHLYPADLLLQRVEAKEKASGKHSFEHDWPPYKRHETTSDRLASISPASAKSGRFEVATPFEDASPLKMLERYYTAQAMLNEEAAQVAKENGIRFGRVQRMVDHVHISDDSGLTTNSQQMLDKAAGLVAVAEAMAPMLAKHTAFNRESNGGNWIAVRNFGFATDDQYGFQEQRRFAVRGVETPDKEGRKKVHFELRMGDSQDPFGIVFQTAAAVGGLNASRQLDAKLVQRTEQQYRSKQPGVDIGSLDFEQSIGRLMCDPLTAFMPQAVKHAAMTRRIEAWQREEQEMPAIEAPIVTPATNQAQQSAQHDMRPG